MEINDKILLHKMLSTDKNSKHFQIILTNKSNIELWKVPKLAVYGVISMVVFQLFIAMLWLADIKSPALTSWSKPKSTQTQNISPARIQKITSLLEGMTSIKELTIEDKKEAFLFNMVLNTPILEDNANLVQLKLVDGLGETTPSKAKSSWRANAISPQGHDTSTVKFLVPKSELWKKSVQKLDLAAFENRKLKFRLSLDLENLRGLLISGKNLSQASSLQNHKK
jgi:hypothetical protein